MSPWTIADLPALDGRTVVITGANSGLGLSTARDLAGAGAHVVLAVRNEDKGRTAAESIDGSTEVRPLDLASLASVRAFAQSWDRPIDVLVNNAGVMMVPLSRTEDRFEMQLGTNHLGHFALTNLLLPHIIDRVVTVASLAHKWGTVDLQDLNYECRKYRPMSAYGQAKLANLLFTSHLQSLLDGVGSPVRSVAAHPGYAATNISNHTGNWFGNHLVPLGDKLISQPAEFGALPTEYAAVIPDIPGNSYVGPDGPLQMRGNPTLVDRAKKAKDAETARLLWELSETLTGTSFPLR